MKIHHYFAAMLCAVALSFSSCTNDNTLNQQLPGNDTASDGVYASLTLTAKGAGSFSQSRASGTWAPGTEQPVLKEGEIQDALVIIYDVSLNDASLSSSSTEKPKQVVMLDVSETSYVTSDGKKIYKTQQFRLSESVTAGDHYVFVIANPGSEAGCDVDHFKNMTLDQIRNDYYTGSLYRDTNGGDISKFDRFIMTSDVERSFNLTQTTIDSHGEVDISGSYETPIIVERLAARIDVSFGPCIVYDDQGGITSHGSKYKHGTSMVTFTNGTPSAEVDSVELPVYDYTAYLAGELIPLYDKFVISDIDVVNVVNNRQLYIQSANNDSRVRIYFRDESWTPKNGENVVNDTNTGTYFDGFYAATQVIQAEGVTKTSTEDHTLGNLILKRNNLYTDNDNVPFYTLGYYRENINCVGTSSLEQAKEGKTGVKITGKYKKAADLPSKYSEHTMNLTFTIMHCHLDPSTASRPIPHPRINGSMSFAIGRNTIYRLRIDKVLRDSENVYVIWYYDSDNDGTFEPYATTTPFGSDIVDKNSAPID